MRKIDQKALKVGDTIRCHGILEAVQNKIELEQYGIHTQRNRGLKKNEYILTVTEVPEE